MSFELFPGSHSFLGVSLNSRPNPHPALADWAALLPDEDYRFSMRFHREPAEQFFGPTAARVEILAQRARWLDETPGHYAAVTGRARPLLLELAALTRDWLGADAPESPDDLALCQALGRQLEPDFLLLQPDASGSLQLDAACVCFPSAWNLAEKIGQTIETIHGAVPRLNAQAGAPIQQFLERLKPGPAWRRANWGLSRSPEWNQHPDRQLPRLDATATAGDVWLRVEHQAFVRLSGNGVLFGIRIGVHPLDELIQIPEARRGLHRALRTMPEDVAAYKGIADAREVLLSLTRE